MFQCSVLIAKRLGAAAWPPLSFIVCYFASAMVPMAFWSFSMSLSRRSLIKGLTSAVLFRLSTVTAPASAFTSVGRSRSTFNDMFVPHRLVWNEWYVDQDLSEVK